MLPIDPPSPRHPSRIRRLWPSCLAALALSAALVSAPAVYGQQSLGTLLFGTPAQGPVRSAVPHYADGATGGVRTAQAVAPYNRFGQQIEADRQYLKRFNGTRTTPVSSTHVSVDPASGEPVVNYEEYMQGQPGPVGAEQAPGYPAEMTPGAPGGGCIGGQCAAPWTGSGGFDAGCYGSDSWSQGPCCGTPCYQPMPLWRPRVWVNAAYLLWWVEGFSTPPLVTTSVAGTPRDSAGVLGLATTTILAGGGRMAGDVRSGGRISGGWWFDPSETSGVEAVYMGLAADVENFYAASNATGSPILARPFFNVEAGFEGQDAELVAYPDILSGWIDVRAKSSLQGVEVLWRRALGKASGRRLDFLLGWRYNLLKDELLIQDFKRSLDQASGFAVGTTISEYDLFKTRNTFNGAELGISGQARRYRWTVDLSMKLALGNTESEVVIDGSTTTTVPLPGGGTDVSVTPAGLLAQGTNIGTYRRNEFSMIPELSAMVGYNLTPRLRAMFGYTFMYWSRVARPGDQIDTDLNLTQLDPGGLVGNPRPRFAWQYDDMWAQGMNFALDYHF